jgi:hypothetical protein
MAGGEKAALRCPHHARGEVSVLNLDEIRMARHQAGKIARRGSVIITFGSAALLNINALMYAVTR